MDESSNDLVVRKADIAELLDLRWRVLRTGMPREAARFDGDDHPATLHFGCVSGCRIVACVTIMQSTWLNKPAWQLRGMAVDPPHQGQGLGGSLLCHVERYIQTNPDYPALLWCNARETATAFYKKHGWQIASERFDIPTAGPHFQMFKDLNAAFNADA